MQVHPGLNRVRDLDRKTLVAFYFDGPILNRMSRSGEVPIGMITRQWHVARKQLTKECQMRQTV